MLDTQEKELILKFLTRNYPVSRVKHETRFKRSILFENNESFILSNKNSVKELHQKLSDVIRIVFSSNNETIRIVLNEFLNLK